MMSSCGLLQTNFIYIVKGYVTASEAMLKNKNQKLYKNPES